MLNLATPEWCKAELTYVMWKRTGWALNSRPIGSHCNSMVVSAMWSLGQRPYTSCVAALITRYNGGWSTMADQRAGHCCNRVVSAQVLPQRWLWRHDRAVDGSDVDVSAGRSKSASLKKSWVWTCRSFALIDWFLVICLLMLLCLWSAWSIWFVFRGWRTGVDRIEWSCRLP